MDGENTGDQTTFEDSITPASFTIEHDTTFDTEGSHTIKAKIFYNTNMRGQILLAESNEITITVEAAPETGVLAFTYNDEGTQPTVAFEDARE